MAGSEEGVRRGGTVEVALHRLAEGSRGRVVRVEAMGADGERMKALGLCEGRILEVLRSGDPLIVRVHSSRFGLAQERARQIWVELESGAAPA